MVVIEKRCLKGQVIGYDDNGSWLAGLSFARYFVFYAPHPHILRGCLHV